MRSMRRRSGWCLWSWLLRQLTLAAFCVALATSARAAVDPLIGNILPFSAFYPAVVAATFWGGYWSGMTAFVLSSISGWTLFTSSSLDSGLPIIAEIGSLAFFTGVAICTTVIGRERTLHIQGGLKVGSIRLGRPANDVSDALPDSG